MGCGSQATSTTKLPPYIRPIPIGAGRAYRIPALSAAVARRAPIDGLRCARRPRHVYGAHLELFADRLVIPVPAGIGIAPPVRRDGAYVVGGGCAYPLSTLEPTGVILVEPAAAQRVAALRTLFRIWGQPLTSTRLAGFRGTTLAFVDGRPWRGPPGAIPLRRHAEIVLEIGGALPPHPAYLFPPGL
jgi:hypothetical protein